MLDKHQATHDLNKLQEHVLYIFSQLKQYDTSRINNLIAYKQQQQQESLQRFQEQTLNSINLLTDFEESFFKMLGYVILLKDEGHKHPYFQELLLRYELMEKQLLKLKKIRQKQSFISISLKNKLYNTYLYRYHSWRLHKSLRQEHHFWLIIQSAYFKESKELSYLNDAIKAEEKKQTIVFVAATTAWLIPIVGTALFISITTFYQWANQYSENYKRLLSVITHNGA